MSTPLVNPSLQELIEAVRDLLSQPDPNNTQWSDAELLRYINEAIRLLMAELTDINEGHFAVTTSLDVVTAVETVALPSDCFKVKALYKNVNDGRVLLRYNNNLTTGYSTQGGTDYNTYFPDYMFRGNSLVLHPVPNFSETGSLFLEYYQYPVSLLDGSDQLTAQISPLFRQIVEMYAVYKAKLKESLTTGVRTSDVAKENLADLFKQFKDLNALRSKNPTYVKPFNPEYY